jgi:hypothetical protein
MVLRAFERFRRLTSLIIGMQPHPAADGVVQRNAMPLELGGVMRLG